MDDPYLAWSDATDFAGHAAIRAGGQWLPLLLELGPEQFDAIKPAVQLPSLYSRDDAFATCLARRADLAQLQAQVKHMEFALPLADNKRGGKRPVQRTTRKTPVLAIIDRGCAFLNQAFRKSDDPTQTRILALWDQGRAAQTAAGKWKTPAGMGYGRELERSDINALIAELGHQPESAVYKAHNYLLDEGGRVQETAHGTHVLDTACGLVGSAPPHSSAKPAKDDRACEAPLIFVDVPGLGPGDSTGAASGAYLLDALKFIRHRAGAKTDVVVSISLGALAGPHDGRSLVERAIDKFLERDGHMFLTVAAGNAALEKWHVHGDLAGAKQAELRWRLRSDDPTDSFLEVWLKTADTGLAPPQIQIAPPVGQPTPWLDITVSKTLLSSGAAISAGIFSRPASRTGADDLMVLVALAPCAGPRAGAAPGLWCVRLRHAAGAESSPTLFDAWIQRDQPDEDVGPSVQSWFESVAGNATIDGTGALSNLASGTQPLVVGAANAQDGQASAYSSRGVLGDPRRRAVRDIDLLALADESATQPGLVAAGVLSGTLFRMGGTSVAAPVAARRLLNDLAKLLEPADARPKGKYTLVAPTVGDLKQQWLQNLPQALDRNSEAVQTWRPSGDDPPVHG